MYDDQSLSHTMWDCKWHIGKFRQNGYTPEQGDGAASNDEDLLRIVGNEQADVLLFELA